MQLNPWKILKIKGKTKDKRKKTKD